MPSISLPPAPLLREPCAAGRRGAARVASGVHWQRNVECVYQVAVITEICEHHRPGKFWRIEPALSVAVPLGQPRVDLGEGTGLSARSQGPAEGRSRAGCCPSSPPPVAIPTAPCCWDDPGEGQRDSSVAQRHGCFLPLHPRGLQVRARPRPGCPEAAPGVAEDWGPRWDLSAALLGVRLLVAGSSRTVGWRVSAWRGSGFL